MSATVPGKVRKPTNSAARKSRIRDLTSKKENMNFLVTVRTVRIGVHRRMKVAGQAACALAVSVTRL